MEVWPARDEPPRFCNRLIERSGLYICDPEVRLQVEFSSDELILVLVSLVRTTNPAMLRQGPEGFTVDFESIENNQELSADGRLLLMLRAALETAVPTSSYTLELGAAESRRLIETLQQLESLQPWAPDVSTLSRRLRARLAAVE